MNSCKNKGFRHQEVCDNQPHPSSFNIKAAWILTPLRWFFGTLVHCLSWSASFVNAVLNPCPNNSSLNLLACCWVSGMNLDSVIRGWNIFNLGDKAIETIMSIFYIICPLERLERRFSKCVPWTSSITIIWEPPYKCKFRDPPHTPGVGITGWGPLILF